MSDEPEQFTTLQEEGEQPAEQYHLFFADPPVQQATTRDQLLMPNQQPVSQAINADFLTKIICPHCGKRLGEVPE